MTWHSTRLWSSVCTETTYTNFILETMLQSRSKTLPKSIDWQGNSHSATTCSGSLVWVMAVAKAEAMPWGRGHGRFSHFQPFKPSGAFLAREGYGTSHLGSQKKGRHPNQKVDMVKVHFPTDISHSDSALDTPTVAGRLANILPVWQNISSYIYVLNLASGLHVEFDSGPSPYSVWGLGSIHYWPRVCDFIMKGGCGVHFPWGCGVYCHFFLVGKEKQ